MIARPTIMYVVTEDWFFWSHFRPMARAALADGFEVAVACRVRDYGDRIAAMGCRVLPLEADRKSLNPFTVLATLRRMRALIRSERPDVVHLIALRSIILGGLAARSAGVERRVIALTGLGLLGAAEGSKGRIARALIRAVVRWGVDGREARFLFENRTDPTLLGLNADDATKVLIVGGAGVDPADLAPAPLPPPRPLRLAMVARMLWSKGVDLAVDAVRQARRAGGDVELTLFGAPDPSNPKAIPEEKLRDWGQEPGVRWYGRIDQSAVSAVYAAHHVCLLPSRGGEGLPRTILEGAACGRAVLTTDVPGCRDFVRNGIDGFVVAPDDARALAEAISRLLADAKLVEHMGRSARERVLEGFTEAAVGAAVVGLYRRMLA